jgi:hypothetical protein
MECLLICESGNVEMAVSGVGTGLPSPYAYEAGRLEASVS